jgi:NTP pyrophosphatase (non-canonical NTP hydrolase)
MTTVSTTVAGSRAAAMADEFQTHPNALDETNYPALRRTLLEEEHEELLEALEGGDPTQIARELADVVYVVYGTAWVHGIDLDAALDEIHRAAMQKMDAGVRRGDGKIIKPPGFVAPDMSLAVAGARDRAAQRAQTGDGHAR